MSITMSVIYGNMNSSVTSCTIQITKCFFKKPLWTYSKRREPSYLCRSFRPINTTAYTTENEIDDCSSCKSHSPHHDLISFLDYAVRNKLDPKSTVYVGTHYEYTVQRAFERMGMSLKRIGGRGDYGTDIIGKWTVPSTPHPIKVLIQCKAHAGKVNPAHARELEGAMAGAPPAADGSNILCLLVSPNSASKGVQETLGRSRWPMGFALCSTDGKILQMMWNKRAAEGHLAGIKCGLRFINGKVNRREIVLTWKGKTLF